MNIHAYPSKSAEQKLSAIINRGLSFRKKDIQEVTKILEAVRKGGDEALIGYVKKFDAPKLSLNTLKVKPQELSKAKKSVRPGFRKALNRAANQIDAFHKHQIRKSWIVTQRPGTVLGQLINPVESVGIYVPGGTGGTTPLVSSLLMGVIPAKIAGVKRIAITTPPKKDGTVDPHLLVAALKVGATEIYKAGSAWAIAALTYGTQTIPSVDVIVGPGNIYVTLAKKIVSGTVGIDMIAGPSEILIIADKEANPEYIAADLLSQAEHDTMASAILVTDSENIASGVKKAIKTQLKTLARRKTAEKSLSAYGAIFKVPNLDMAFKLANRIAPEHLELHVNEPFDEIGKVRNAGAVFIGDYTPEPVGDYIAGPNHVLPTAGTARFASALSVDHFIRKTNLVHYSREAFKREAIDIIRLADIEGLDAHANAVRVRMKR